MSTPFAAKLRLTAAVLGCASRKELCQRFVAVNPATAFDLERSHKWMQGVALPRNPSVYEDWAKVLGTERPSAWLAGCSVEAFADELCRLFAADRAELEALAARFVRGGAAVGGDPRAGAFVAYSWAMAPGYAGQVIRGLLTLQPGRGHRLAVVYEEGPPVGPIRFSGHAVENGRAVFVDLDVRDDPVIGRFFMVLLTPGRPVDVLCGEFMGSPVSGSAPAPTVTPIALLRIDPRHAPSVAAAPCYLAADEGALAADFEQFGFAEPIASGLAAAVLGFLGRPRDGLARTTADHLARFTTALAGVPVPLAVPIGDLDLASPPAAS
ncbi:MAG: hypothetical protein ACOCY0_06095 [Roseicyclus sp.]